MISQVIHSDDSSDVVDYLSYHLLESLNDRRPGAQSVSGQPRK